MISDSEEIGGTLSKEGEVLKQEGNAVEHTKTFDQDISAGSNTVRFELGESNNAQKD